MSERLLGDGLCRGYESAEGCRRKQQHCSWLCEQAAGRHVPTVSLECEGVLWRCYTDKFLVFLESFLGVFKYDSTRSSQFVDRETSSSCPGSCQYQDRCI